MLQKCYSCIKSTQHLSDRLLAQQGCKVLTVVSSTQELAPRNHRVKNSACSSKSDRKGLTLCKFDYQQPII